MLSRQPFTPPLCLVVVKPEVSLSQHFLNENIETYVWHDQDYVHNLKTQPLLWHQLQDSCRLIHWLQWSPCNWWQKGLTCLSLIDDNMLQRLNLCPINPPTIYFFLQRCLAWRKKGLHSFICGCCWMLCAFFSPWWMNFLHTVVLCSLFVILHHSEAINENSAWLGFCLK